MKIIVKANMPEVLRQELTRLSRSRDRVAIGTTTDAYQPCEGRYRLTRPILEALHEYQVRAIVATESRLSPPATASEYG